MGYSLFSNYHFQMGVTVMGFAEDFGHSLPACLPASPPAADGPRWQRPKNLSQRQAWTVTYGQIIFTLTPFFAQCCISHTSLGRHKRCATRQQYNPRFEVSSPLNPNDLGALLHSFSLLGVLISTFLTASCAQYG